MSQPGRRFYLTGWCSLGARFGVGKSSFPLELHDSFCDCKPSAPQGLPGVGGGGGVEVLWNASVPQEILEVLEDDPPWLLDEDHSLVGPQRPQTDRSPADPASSRRHPTWSSSRSALPPHCSWISSYPGKVYPFYEPPLPLPVLGKTDSMTSRPKQKRLPPSSSTVKTCQRSRLPYL